jgi:hypothetical protein
MSSDTSTRASVPRLSSCWRSRPRNRTRVTATYDVTAEHSVSMVRYGMVWCPSYPPSAPEALLRVVASYSVCPVSEQHGQTLKSALVRRWVCLHGCSGSTRSSSCERLSMNVNQLLNSSIPIISGRGRGPRRGATRAGHGHTACHPRFTEAEGQSRARPRLGGAEVALPRICDPNRFMWYAICGHFCRAHMRQTPLICG